MPGGRHQYHWQWRPVMNYRKALLVWGPQAAGPQWAPKELKMVLTLFKNGFHLHPNALKSIGGWGSAPDPNSEGERLRRLPVCHAELKKVSTLFKNEFHLHPNAPKSVGG